MKWLTTFEDLDLSPIQKYTEKKKKISIAEEKLRIKKRIDLYQKKIDILRMRLKDL